VGCRVWGVGQYCSVKEGCSLREAGGAGGAGEEKTGLSEQYWGVGEETTPETIELEAP
jgi:hypothetical protein